jgi:hypothetical protein
MSSRRNNRRRRSVVDVERAEADLPRQSRPQVLGPVVSTRPRRRVPRCRARRSAPAMRSSQIERRPGLGACALAVRGPRRSGDRLPDRRVVQIGRVGQPYPSSEMSWLDLYCLGRIMRRRAARLSCSTTDTASEQGEDGDQLERPGDGADGRAPVELRELRDRASTTRR